MWWLWYLDVFSFDLNFWCKLLWDLLLAIFSNPWVYKGFLFLLIYFSLAGCLGIWWWLSVLQIISILYLCLLCDLMACYSVYIVSLDYRSSALIRTLNSLWAGLRLFQLPSSTFGLSLLDPLLFIVFPNLLAHTHRQSHVYRILVYEVSDAFTNIINFRQLDQHRYVFIEGSVLHVIVPGKDWNSTLWLEHIRSWWVIDDHRVFHVAPERRHIFDKHAIYEGAVFSEETLRAVSFGVHLVHERIRILYNS